MGRCKVVFYTTIRDYILHYYYTTITLLLKKPKSMGWSY